MSALRFLPAFLVLLPVLATAQSVAPSGAATPNNSAPPPKLAPAPVAPSAMTPTDSAQVMVAKAINDFNQNRTDDAFNSLNEAIKRDPRCAEAYLFRGAIYSNKKFYKEAETDFKSAIAINPAPMFRVQLAELKFLQKQYDAARADYAGYVKDESIGELAKFKVFLCDLYGGHLDLAKKEYDEFNASMSGPDYYFANVTWAIYNKKYDDARSYYASAFKIYPPAKIGPYSKSLDDLGLLPIPGTPTPSK